MATLKCLGFFQRSVFKIYLIQILGVGFLGGVFGGLAGVSIQQVFPLFLQNFLPVELDFSIQPIVLLVGIVAGILMALLFSLLPLLKTLKVSPIQVLRDQSAFFKVSFKTRSIVYLLIGAFVFIGSYILLHDVFISSVFLGSLLLVFVLLNSISSMFLLILRKLQLKRRGIVVKYGVKSIFRPGNQTKVLLLSIGMASFLIASITSLQSMLMEQTKVGDVSNQANMLLIDVQRDQVKGIEKKLTNKNLKLFNNVPIVSIRINKINGRSISELRRDSLLNIKDWILNNEYRVTYTDSLDEGEEVIEGTWIGTFHEKGEWIPISVADYFLRDAQVNLGDSIIWNVQGVNMKTIIRSVRVINWSSLDLKFTILFPKGVLEKAPQVNILATKISSDKESAEIQNTLVKSYPNLSVIDLRRTLKLVGEILTKISWVLQFMTIFTILIGVFILIGTIRATKYQRIKENALLRTLGAKGNQVLKISMIEFSVIAIIGSFSGLMLSILSAYALAVYGFKIPFSIPFFTLVFILAISVLLVLLLGLLNNLKAIRTKPLQVLKG
jgi:putative ABC transport system permease protein